jgi:hypothetical protein
MEPTVIPATHRPLIPHESAVGEKPTIQEERGPADQIGGAA